jgi:molybdopterin synthase sulfur carrier subunit
MSVRLVFLGKLADLGGAPEREVDAPLDWAALVEALAGDFGAILDSDKFKLAVNGTLLADKRSLAAADGDEVALLPPVSGG